MELSKRVAALEAELRGGGGDAHPQDWTLKERVEYLEREERMRATRRFG